MEGTNQFEGMFLVRLPSVASLARAACAVKRWRRVASYPAFLRRLHALHPGQAQPLLGHYYFTVCSSSRPVFQPAQPIFSDPDLSAVVRHGDFFLTPVASMGRLEVEDCHQGRLLRRNCVTEELNVVLLPKLGRKVA
uniref:F-box domain-containing protein n=1 Tax=Oryza punctata TaxID=4537 RepID=A0A0E0JJ35_ORYPU